MAAASFIKLQNSALQFTNNPQEFYQNIQAVVKPSVDIPIFLIAKKIFDGKMIRYCGTPIDQFPLTYEYLKRHSTKLQEKVNALISVITKATKMSTKVTQSIGHFLSQSSQHTQSIHFALMEVPVIHIADQEIPILKGKIADLDDPSVFVTLPLIITLRLLTRPDPFTEVNCPTIFSRTKGIQKLASEKSLDLISYLNQLRDQFIGLKPELFKDLEERIYGSLATQNIQKNGETDQYYEILSALSGAISRGERSKAMNFCMQLAVSNYL